MNTSNVLEVLEKAVKNNKNVVDELARAIEEIARFLNNLDVEAFSKGDISFTNNAADSNVGSYGPAFFVNKTDDDYGFTSSRVIESGNYYKSYFLHDDINVSILTASKADVIEAARQLPTFIKAFIADYETNTKKATDALPALKRMVEATKTQE